MFAVLLLGAGAFAAEVTIKALPLPDGAQPHDVAPVLDGSVWCTAHYQAVLGRLDPVTGRTEHIPLGVSAAPQGVIVGPNGAAWVTDGCLNAIVRVDPTTRDVRVFPLPSTSEGTNNGTRPGTRN